MIKAMFLTMCMLFLLLHLVAENLSIFYKFAFAGIGKPMQGMNYSSFYSLLSRGFIGGYAVGISFAIEKEIININDYSISFCATLVVAGIVSIQMSKYNVIDDTSNLKFSLKNAIAIKSKWTKNGDLSNNVLINLLCRPFTGLQFLVVGFGFAVAMVYPDYRLTIFSTAPMVGMLFTAMTLLYVEASLSHKMDELSVESGQIIREYLTSRGLSFFLGAALVLFVLGLKYLT